MDKNINRRSFLKNVAAAGAIGLSLEEQILLAQTKSKDNSPAKTNKKNMSMAKIGSVNISRLICGGNLISGFAHSRDLIYVSSLLKHYFTDENIAETWQICEQQGINTMIFYANDEHAIDIFKTYRKNGGKIQWLAQIEPTENDHSIIKKVADLGAVGAFLVGNKSDLWCREDKVYLVEKVINKIKAEKIIAGVAAHALNTVIDIEANKIDLDFYMKTLHTDNYWSKRRPDQYKDVIDNYDVDNYWAMTPKETIAFMEEVKKPWIAYKILAAGAINPNEGFDHAFKNGADFACVGMFDFQVEPDANIAKKTIAKNKKRSRPWLTA